MRRIALLAARIATFAFALAATSSASAGILISIAETGGDVVATVSGSITLPGGASPTYGENQSRMAPSQSFFEFGTQPNVEKDLYAFSENFPAFGTSGYSGPNYTSAIESGIADNERFVVASGGLAMNQAYAGGEISGTLTWASQTFTTLGLTAGTYSRALLGDGTQTVTIQVGPAPDNAVPAPSTLALVLGGLMLSGYPVRRRLGKA